MPQLGETVTEGTITRWFKQVGEQVAVDEPLFEVSTDKVDSEVPAPAAGVVSEILVAEGDTVDVGARLAVISDSAGAAAPAARRTSRRAARRGTAGVSSGAATACGGAGPAAAVGATPGASSRTPEPPAAPPPATARRPPRRDRSAPEPATRRSEARTEPVVGAGRARGALLRPSPPRGAASPRRRLSNAGGPPVTSPLVRRMIAEQGLDPSQIQGSGDGGRITRNDVVEAGRGRRAECAGAPSASGARARPERARRAHPKRPRLRRPSARGTSGRAHVGRRRRSVRQHPAPHRGAHGALEGDERARVHVGARRLRARRSGPAREPGLVARPRRASRSRTCRSSSARSAMSCTTTRT